MKFPPAKLTQRKTCHQSQSNQNKARISARDAGVEILNLDCWTQCNSDRTIDTIFTLLFKYMSPFFFLPVPVGRALALKPMLSAPS